MSPRGLILASASAARAGMLRDAGLDFQIRPANLDEADITDTVQRSGSGPGDVAQELAAYKALYVSLDHPDALVLGADQVLNHNAELIDRAFDREGARATLTRLRGDTHTLISGAAIARDGDVLWEHSERVEMTVRPFSDAFLDIYLANAGSALTDAVGCYHLEGLGAQLFSRVEGDYFTVLGLPLLAVLQALRDIGHLTE